jgi:hypothetical protein
VKWYAATGAAIRNTQLIEMTKSSANTTQVGLNLVVNKDCGLRGGPAVERNGTKPDVPGATIEDIQSLQL